MVSPPRGGHPVFPLAQNGYMSRSKSSYGTVSLTFNILFTLVAYISPLASAKHFRQHRSPDIRNINASLQCYQKTHHAPTYSVVCKLLSPDCSSLPQISRDSLVVVTSIWGSQGRTRYVSVSAPLSPLYLNLSSLHSLWTLPSSDPLRPTPTFNAVTPLPNSKRQMSYRSV